MRYLFVWFLLDLKITSSLVLTTSLSSPLVLFKMWDLSFGVGGRRLVESMTTVGPCLERQRPVQETFYSYFTSKHTSCT